MNYDFSIFWDLRNLQEQVKKAFCYQKLFWPFTVWINCSSDLKFFENSRLSALSFLSFSHLLEQFFLTVGLNNFHTVQCMTIWPKYMAIFFLIQKRGKILKKIVFFVTVLPTVFQGLQNLACASAVFFNDVTRSWKYHSYFLDNSFQNQSKTNGTAQNEIHKIGQVLLEPFQPDSKFTQSKFIFSKFSIKWH